MLAHVRNRLMQTVLGLAMAAAMTLWNFRRVCKGARGWFAKLWNGLLVLAALSILWVALAFHLISFGTRF